jgi:cyclic dehypoxanthinyl futalosine synthase
MVIGFGETIEQRLSHLASLRDFQDLQKNPMPSFLCWSYKPYNNALGGSEISTREYLRWMAICRVYLDNFKHIRTSVLTKNEHALEALKYGADDFDLPTEDEVTQKAGATVSHDFERILDTAKSLGFSPVHRRPFT